MIKSQSGVCAAFLFFCLAAGFVLASHGQTKNPALALQAQLIWGTDEEKPNDPALKEIEPELTKKLMKIFKWKNYFEVKRERFAVEPGRIKKVEMSSPCRIEVENLGNASVEVKLYGKGQLWGKKRHAFGTGKCLVLGGDDKNDTAWFVVISESPQ